MKLYLQFDRGFFRKFAGMECPSLSDRSGDIFSVMLHLLRTKELATLAYQKHLCGNTVCGVPYGILGTYLKEH